MALRAAAILIVATGLNDIVASSLPRYEPLYLYIAAAAVVTLLDGLLAGALSAVIGTAFYILLFGPRPPRIDATALVPLGLSFAAVAVAAAVRTLYLRGRRPPPAFELHAVPPMLEATIVGPNDEVAHALDGLRSELRSALSEASAARQRERTLELELRQARQSAAVDAERIVAGANRAVELLTERIERMEQDGRAREWRLEQAWSDARTSLHHSLEVTTAQRDALTARVTELEEWMRTAETARIDVQRERDELRRALERRQGSLETLAGERDELRRELDARERAMAELESTVETLTTERDAATRNLDSARASAQREDTRLAAARAEMAALEQRAADMQATIERLTAERDEEHGKLAAALAERAAVEQSAAEMQATIERLTAERETERGKLAVAVADTTAVEQRAAAMQATIERLTAERETERGKLAVALAETAAVEERAADLRATVERLTAERDASREELAVDRGQFEALDQRTVALQSTIERLTADRDTLRAELDAAIAAAAAAQTEFDRKLQDIVAHLAEDHEADLGNALMEKEAARAEMRVTTSRLSQLQQKVEEERAKWTAQRQALLEKVSQAEARTRQAVDDGTQLMARTRAAWQGELDRLSATIASLEHERDDAYAQLSGGAPVVAAPAVPAPVAPKPRVLVAHPDAELRQAAKTSLERIGYEVVTAADGLEGLRVAIAVQPDVVIADASMPKMDGRELCQLLKSQLKTAHIKVVLLTRASDQTRPEEGFTPDDVLRKPVPFEVLRSSLSQLLAREQ